ncbi:head maturation protease, ClpP-related [Paracoccus methylovorus]|uniref:head maturation protease, ClpP-related n=1 Tax=Paracoccus methylovorus TaxID=2812658 RepID=UPI001F064E5C|nr:head maturation protease, ClpP-related [Paracoccus methylovorus]
MRKSWWLKLPRLGEGENTATALGAFLEQHAGEPVRVTVNSFGGHAAEGAAMMALIGQHGTVRAEVLGIAASAASLLLMEAAHIAMHSAALLMIHNPAALAFGTADELRGEATTLDKIADTYAAAYSRCTGHPLSRIRAWMDAESWMNAEEALALNFCDEITGEGERAKAVAAFDYTRFKSAPAQLLRRAARNGWAGETAASTPAH